MAPIEVAAQSIKVESLLAPTGNDYVDLGPAVIEKGSKIVMLAFEPGVSFWEIYGGPYDGCRFCVREGHM